MALHRLLLKLHVPVPIINHSNDFAVSRHFLYSKDFAVFPVFPEGLDSRFLRQNGLNESDDWPEVCGETAVCLPAPQVALQQVLKHTIFKHESI